MRVLSAVLALFGGLAVAAVVGAIASFPAAWGLMLSAGIVHAQLLPAVIPAGYWAVWPLAWVLVTIGVGVAAGSRANSE